MSRPGDWTPKRHISRDGRTIDDGRPFIRKIDGYRPATHADLGAGQHPRLFLAIHEGYYERAVQRIFADGRRQDDPSRRRASTIFSLRLYRTGDTELQRPPYWWFTKRWRRLTGSKWPEALLLHPEIYEAAKSILVDVTKVRENGYRDDAAAQLEAKYGEQFRHYYKNASTPQAFALIINCDRSAKDRARILDGLIERAIDRREWFYSQERDRLNRQAKEDEAERQRRENPRPYSAYDR